MFLNTKRWKLLFIYILFLLLPALQIKADWPDPYLRVAFAYLNKGDNAKAAENLEKFIKLEPGTERTAQAQAILDAIKK